MAGDTLTPTHPTRVCVDALANALEEYLSSGVDPDWLGSEERAALLVDLTRVENRIAAFKARVLAGADALAERDGFKDPGAWLAATTHTQAAEARAAYRLGVRMRHHSAVASAFEAGGIGAEHATAVIASVRELKASGEVPADLLVDVERRLVGHCRQFTPAEVRRLGRQALEVIDPERADAILERLLAAEERRAYAASRLSARDQGDGTMRVHATVPHLPGSVLLAALDAYTNPARPTEDDGGGEGGVSETGDPEHDRLTLAQKRGRAFVTLLEHLPTDGLPVSGGTPVGIGVTPRCREAPRRRRRRPPRRRHAALGRPDPAAGVHARGLPARPGRAVAAARPRADPPAVLGRADQGEAGRAAHLPGARVHRALRLVPRPPPRRLGGGRSHRSRPARPALSSPPPPHPRPRLRPPLARGRHRDLPSPERRL